MIHINLVVFKTRLVCPPNKPCFQCKEASFEEQTRLLLNRVEYLCFFPILFCNFEVANVWDGRYGRLSVRLVVVPRLFR